MGCPSLHDGGSSWTNETCRTQACRPASRSHPASRSSTDTCFDQVSVESGLAMADSILYATARDNEATLWTQDGDFEGLENVEFRPRS